MQANVDAWLPQYWLCANGTNITCPQGKNPNAPQGLTQVLVDQFAPTVLKYDCNPLQVETFLQSPRD